MTRRRDDEGQGGQDGTHRFRPLDAKKVRGAILQAGVGELQVIGHSSLPHPLGGRVPVMWGGRGGDAAVVVLVSLEQLVSEEASTITHF